MTSEIMFIGAGMLNCSSPESTQSHDELGRALSISSLAGQSVSHLLECDYVYAQQGCEICVFCQLDLRSLQIVNLTFPDCADKEYLEAEFLVVSVHGEIAQLDAKDGTLTEKGKTDLKLIMAGFE